MHDPGAISVKANANRFYTYAYDVDLSRTPLPIRLVLAPLTLGRLMTRVHIAIYIGGSGFLLSGDGREREFRFLRRHGVLPDERIRAVRTGCCPHTAIRDDITANLDAVDELVTLHDPDLVLVESGGDNLTATFSYGLIDKQIFVVDVAGGDKVPRKGGPGVIRSDLLVINKTDLAPMVGADLDVMRSDAERLREDRPTVLVSLREQPDAGPIAEWVTALVAARRG